MCKLRFKIMKMKTFLCVLVATSLLPLCFSCQHGSKVQTMMYNDSLFQVITIDPNAISKTEKAKISEISESVEYIPLQTTDSVLIGGIEKLIVWQGDFFIWDKQAESIYRFDGEGKFKSKFFKQGGGPGEYPRIFDFNMDRSNGHLWIYSDMTNSLYEYTAEGEFIQKIKSPMRVSTFAVKADQAYCYARDFVNEEYFKATFPRQYRYLMLQSGVPQQQALEYTYRETGVPLSTDNFSYYKDTVLLTEFLKPLVYSIDSVGRLVPRYKLVFTTNTIHPSFDDEIDLKQLQAEEKAGNFTDLFGGFFETDNYLFFNYARGLVGTGYVDKKTGIVHNQGYFLTDDFNDIGLSVSILFADEDYVYKTKEPSLLLRTRELGGLSPYLEKVCQEMQEFDNPVIVKVKLKK